VSLADLSPIAVAVMAAGLFVAALARGYSGFGFSALLVSSWSLVTDPVRAVTLAVTLEVIASVIQAFSVWRDIPWRRVALLLGGAAIGSPAGVWLVAHASERALRLGIALFVLATVLALSAGFTLRRRPSAAGTAAVGVVSGLVNGAVAMGGLPVVLFFTADGDSPQRIRALVIAYFFLLDLMAIAWMARSGLVGSATGVDALAALPLLVLGMWLGGRHFLGATPESFRRITLLLLGGLAILGIARSLWSG
jgi:uncharacterized protein